MYVFMWKDFAYTPHSPSVKHQISELQDQHQKAASKFESELAASKALLSASEETLQQEKETRARESKKFSADFKSLSDHNTVLESELANLYANNSQLEVEAKEKNEVIDSAHLAIKDLKHELKRADETIIKLQESLQATVQAGIDQQSKAESDLATQFKVWELPHLMSN